jgi:RNA polymerase sigma-70 factor (ECF subfamily)
MRAKLEREHKAGYSWALACCRWDRDEAMEVLQTSYLKILDGKAKFDGRSEFKTWLFGVIRRTAMESRRRRTVREIALKGWFRKNPAPSAEPTPDSVHEKAETHQRLRNLLQRLSERQRDLLHLVFYQDMTIEQAAGVLGLNLGTARTHYKRGKAQLKKLLLESGEESWERMTMTTSG